MATKSGFSKGWQGFVDHKWSKKRHRALLAVLSSQTLPTIRVRGQLVPKLSGRYRRFAAKPRPNRQDRRPQHEITPTQASTAKPQ
jgi:hypothetical protein